MKIQTSLISARPYLANVAIVTLAILSVALLVVSLRLVFATQEMRTEEPQLRERLSRLTSQIEGIAARKSLPPIAELDTTRQRVAALNQLISLKGWTTPRLLAWFEASMPDNVYLVSFHHRPRDGEVLLVAESSSAEALTTLLLRMEKESQFSEVLLNRQGIRSGAGASTLQFEVRVRQRS
jgi:hypothetical protein